MGKARNTQNNNTKGGGTKEWEKGLTISATLAAESNRIGYLEVSMKSFVTGWCLKHLERLLQRQSFSEPSTLMVTSIDIGEHWNGPPRTSSTSDWVKGPSMWPASTSSLRYSSINSDLSSTDRLLAQMTVSSRSGKSPIKKLFLSLCTKFRYWFLREGKCSKKDSKASGL